jgi:hypothetical protein
MESIYIIVVIFLFTLNRLDKLYLNYFNLINNNK